MLHSLSGPVGFDFAALIVACMLFAAFAGAFGGILGATLAVLAGSIAALVTRIRGRCSYTAVQWVSLGVAVLGTAVSSAWLGLPVLYSPLTDHATWSPVGWTLGMILPVVSGALWTLWTVRQVARDPASTLLRDSPARTV
jgi:hypothetical protein